MLNVKSALSTSEADKLISVNPSSSKDTSDTVARTGASLTDITVTEKL